MPSPGALHSRCCQAAPTGTRDGGVTLVSPGACVTVTNILSLPLLQGECQSSQVPFPLPSPFPHGQWNCWSNIVQEIEWCIGETKGGTLSQSKESRGNAGHLESMLPEISVLECLPLEVGWKYYVFTVFLKEEHKEKTIQ